MCGPGGAAAGTENLKNDRRNKQLQTAIRHRLVGVSWAGLWAEMVMMVAEERVVETSFDAFLGIRWVWSETFSCS